MQTLLILCLVTVIFFLVQPLISTMLVQRPLWYVDRQISKRRKSASLRSIVHNEMALLSFTSKRSFEHLPSNYITPVIDNR